MGDEAALLSRLQQEEAAKFEEQQALALQEEAARFESVDAHQGASAASLVERYGENVATECPYIKRMGSAGIELVQKLATLESSPNKGPTVAEILAAKKAARETEAAKKQPSKESTPIEVIENIAKTTDPTDVHEVTAPIALNEVLAKPVVLANIETAAEHVYKTMQDMARNAEPLVSLTPEHTNIEVPKSITPVESASIITPLAIETPQIVPETTTDQFNETIKSPTVNSPVETFITIDHALVIDRLQTLAIEEEQVVEQCTHSIQTTDELGAPVPIEIQQSDPTKITIKAPVETLTDIVVPFSFEEFLPPIFEVQTSPVLMSVREAIVENLKPAPFELPEIVEFKKEALAETAQEIVELIKNLGEITIAEIIAPSSRNALVHQKLTELLYLLHIEQPETLLGSIHTQAELDSFLSMITSLTLAQEDMHQEFLQQSKAFILLQAGSISHLLGRTIMSLLGHRKDEWQLQAA